MCAVTRERFPVGCKSNIRRRTRQSEPAGAAAFGSAVPSVAALVTRSSGTAALGQEPTFRVAVTGLSRGLRVNLHGALGRIGLRTADAGVLRHARPPRLSEARIERLFGEPPQLMPRQPARPARATDVEATERPSRTRTRYAVPFSVVEAYLHAPHRHARRSPVSVMRPPG